MQRLLRILLVILPALTFLYPNFWDFAFDVPLSYVALGSVVLMTIFTLSFSLFPPFILVVYLLFIFRTALGWDGSLLGNADGTLSLLTFLLAFGAGQRTVLRAEGIEPLRPVGMLVLITLLLFLGTYNFGFFVFDSAWTGFFIALLFVCPAFLTGIDRTTLRQGFKTFSTRNSFSEYVLIFVLFVFLNAADGALLLELLASFVIVLGCILILRQVAEIRPYDFTFYLLLLGFAVSYTGIFTHYLSLAVVGVGVGYAFRKTPNILVQSSVGYSVLITLLTALFILSVSFSPIWEIVYVIPIIHLFRFITYRLSMLYFEKKPNFNYQISYMFPAIVPLIVVVFLSDSGAITSSDYNTLATLAVGNAVFTSVALCVMLICFPSRLLELNGEKEVFDDEASISEMQTDKVISAHLQRFKLVYYDKLRNFYDDWQQNELLALKTMQTHYVSAFHATLERLEQEAEHIAEASTEHVRRNLKKRVRESRGNLALVFGKAYSELEPLKRFEQISHLSPLFDELSLEFNTLPSYRKVQDSDRFSHLANQSGLIRTLKLVKRSYLGLRRLLSKDAELYQTVRLPTLFNFHFFDRFAVLVKVLVSQLCSFTLSAIQKTTNFYNKTDEQFLRLLDFIDNETEPEELAKRFSYMVTQCRQEIEDEFAVLMEDHTGYEHAIEELYTRNYTLFANRIIADAAVIDTIELPYRKRRYEDKQATFYAELAASGQLAHPWDVATKGSLGQSLMNIQLRILQGALRKVINDRMKHFEETTQARLTDVLESTRASLQKIKSMPASSEDEFKSLRKQLLYSLKIGSIKPIEVLKSELNEHAFVERLFALLHKVILEQPRFFKLTKTEFIPTGDGQFPTETELYHVPFQKVIKSVLEHEVTENLKTVTAQISVSVENIIQGLDDIVQLVETTVIDEGEIAETVARLFSELELQLAEIETFSQSVSNSVEQTVIKEVVVSLNQVKTIASKNMEGYAKDAEPTSKNTTETGRELIDRLSEKLQPTVAKLKSVYSRGKALREKRRTYSGAGKTLAEQLEEINELPFMYRKALTTEAIEINDYFVARDTELSQIKTAIANWQAGQRQSVLIHGEMGTGKTSLINVLLKDSSLNIPTARVKLQPPVKREEMLCEILSKHLAAGSEAKTLEELAEHVHASEMKRLIAIESLHYLVEKNVNGYALLEKTLAFFAQTSPHILWICTVSERASRFLSVRSKIDNFFTSRIGLRPLSAADLQHVIETRNLTSGFEFIYDEAQDGGAKLRQFIGKKFNLKSRTKEEFFSRLAKHSRGNIHAALFCWLRSIRLVDRHVFLVHQPSALRINTAWNLNAEELILLGSILECGALSALEASRLLNSAQGSAEALLENLHGRELLHKKVIDSRAYYAVRKLAVSEISNQLNKRGF